MSYFDDVRDAFAMALSTARRIAYTAAVTPVVAMRQLGRVL